MSILIEGLEHFIFQGKNVTQIYVYINEKFNLTIAGQKNIFRFF
jgi:hypothetical protein